MSKIVLLTSPSANNGKTLTSRKFAMGFAKIGYKTLLMDCDLKQGDMHKFLDRSSIKTSDLYESQDSSNYEKFKISENLYFIPRIRKLSSTFNWINSKKFDQLLIDLKKSFDYVIIDSTFFISTRYLY